MEKKSIEYQRLNFMFILVCCLNFIIIAFISGGMMITLYEIIRMNEANTFLININSMPFTPPYSIFLYSMFIYLTIIYIMVIRSNKKITDTLNNWLCFFQLLLCLLLMYILGFSSNAVLLLLVSNIMLTFKNTQSRNVFLLVTVIFYLFSSYNVIPLIKTISFNEYIAFYNNGMQLVLTSINTSLHTLNIVFFIAFMFLLIQLEVNESKRVTQLNSELRILNEQLKEYASIQEKMGETKERNRLAREIHDTLGHTLTGLSVGIDATMMILDIDSEATRKQLQTLSETARQGLKDVRRSVNKLRPDALENHSLQEALKKMIIDFEMVSNAHINFVCHLEELKFSQDEEEVVYRVIQEGLTNAIRHGHANNIFISFALENEKLILIIEDDGVGCSNIKDGFGLHHMRERIKMLDGILRVYGHDGFVVIAEIPLRKDVSYD